MKLQAQYNKATIISSLLVLLIAGIGYYFLLHYVLGKQLDDTIRVEEVEILDYVGKNHSLPDPTTFKDQRTWFKKVETPVTRHFSTERSTDPKGQDALDRQLTFPVTIDGVYYAAYVAKSQQETEDLVGLILLVTVALLLLLSVILFFFNQFTLKRLWRPFHSMLLSIKNFDLNAPSAIRSPQTSIDEFNEMNESVNMMTGKVVKDYVSLKNFTDHASHEIQTPLAVINSKLDILIQDPGLREESLQQIQGIYNAVEKMSKLSQSLLLLTKIENNQFNNTAQINIKQVIETKLQELEEWTQASSIEIITALNDQYVAMNPQLAEILISNLVINAIKHSSVNTVIMIRLENNTLSISNDGPKELETALIFDRFWKSPQSDGTGLGLAIARQICDKYGFELLYAYKNGAHHFNIVFRS